MKRWKTDAAFPRWVKWGIVILLVTGMVTGGVLLYRHYAVSELYAWDRILPVPAVYGMDGQQTLTRETETHFCGQQGTRVEDCFVLRNENAEEKELTIVYPVLPPAQGDSSRFSFQMRIGDTLCREFWTAKEVVFDYGMQLSALQDGTWFRTVFPEGPENRGVPETETSATESAVRYYAAECSVAPGETLRVQLSFTFSSNAHIMFCENAEAAPCSGHILKLFDSDSVKIGKQNLTSASIQDGKSIELNPTQTDYYLYILPWKYR